MPTTVRRPAFYAIHFAGTGDRARLYNSSQSSQAVAGPVHLSYSFAMQVKLLDLQAQYLPLREEIRYAIDDVCDTQALILGPAVDRF